MDKAQIRKRLLRRYAAVLLVLGLYYVLVTKGIFAFKCPFRLITGHKCPGCGASAMCLHFARGELHSAFASNPVLFFLFPLMAVCAAVKLVFVPRIMMPESKVYKAVILGVVVLLLGFGIVRNIFSI